MHKGPVEGTRWLAIGERYVYKQCEDGEASNAWRVIGRDPHVDEVVCSCLGKRFVASTNGGVGRRVSSAEREHWNGHLGKMESR